MNDSSQMMHRWPPASDPMSWPLFSDGAATAKPGWINWKGKKAAEKRKKAATAAAIAAGATAGPLGYRPPALKELQIQNRAKARRFYPKKKFTQIAPSAPWNTTSFIIRAKKSGGIASLISPCPVTPAILPTPKFSPSREGLVDMAKEEWGVDGYGSMKGLIRLRPGGGATADGDDDDVDDEEGSSGSDVEEHLEVERRLDQDLSRFEMVYPNRVGEHDMQFAQLEEENLMLKGRLFLMEREMGDLRRRVMALEAENRARDGGGIENNEHGEASENDGGGDVCSESSVGDGEETSEIRTPMCG